MSWASRRRFLILTIIGAFVAAFFAVIYISVFYKAPSCTDGIKNQDETGIDCGGACSYLCAAEQRPPTVLFTKAIQNGPGRTDVVASIENTNATAAAKNVPYTVTLYGPGKLFVQQVTGTIDLPPSTTVPVFIPNVTTGSQKIVNVFLSIDPAAPKWFMPKVAPRALPGLKSPTIGGSATAPRIDTVLENTGITPLENVKLIVFVRNEKDDVFAASRTVVPVVPAQGQATATFTWNQAFTEKPAAIEIVPVVELP